MNNIIYWIWLSRIEELTSLQKEELLKMFKSPENIWRLSRNDLKQIDGINEKIINIITNQKYRNNLGKYIEYMKKNEIKLVTLYDKEYPEKLKEIYDKPVSLFYKGNIELLKKRNIAIVGCRDCSVYGKNTARDISYKLAEKGQCIVSGLARGIDKYAHLGALEASGDTIAVIGNGLDIIYPYENKNLSERILKNNGLIVTEYIIGTKPEKNHFPARNRIISGLSEGVIVVEAKEKSGALITADFALEQGREVFAIPGNIDSLNSVGTNELIKQGANVLTDYKDVLNVLVT